MLNYTSSESSLGDPDYGKRFLTAQGTSRYDVIIFFI